MIIVEAIVLSLVVALIRGGSIRRVGELNLRGMALVLIPPALIVLTYAKRIPGIAFLAGMAPFIHIAAYVTVLVIIWLNRRLPGMALIGLAAALNLIVIAANGGQMPVSAAAVRDTGNTHMKRQLDRKDMARHSKLDRNTKLWFLSDVIPVRQPDFLGPCVVSAGDIILSVGLFVLIQAAACSRKPNGSKRARSAEGG